VLMYGDDYENADDGGYFRGLPRAKRPRSAVSPTWDNRWMYPNSPQRVGEMLDRKPMISLESRNDDHESDELMYSQGRREFFHGSYADAPTMRQYATCLYEYISACVRECGHVDLRAVMGRCDLNHPNARLRLAAFEGNIDAIRNAMRSGANVDAFEMETSYPGLRLLLGGPQTNNLGTGLTALLYACAAGHGSPLWLVV
jgi:hypothetical protein